MISLLILNIALAITWAALMGSFTLTCLGVGFRVGVDLHLPHPRALSR